MCYRAPRALHSFPTRRSSDLPQVTRVTGAADQSQPASVITYPGSGIMLPLATAVAGALKGTRANWGKHIDRKSTRLNSSHVEISYAVFCSKKKKKRIRPNCVV